MVLRPERRLKAQPYFYFRCAPRFEVKRADLTWMAPTLFIGTDAKFPDQMKMVFYEVV
jgi:Protein of unknown function (DUF3237)